MARRWKLEGGDKAVCRFECDECGMRSESFPTMTELCAHTQDWNMGIAGDRVLHTCPACRSKETS